MWCESLEHLTIACPRRLKVVDNSVAKCLAPPHQPRPTAIELAYVMSKKEAATFGTIITGTLFLNSKPFCVLFDSDATHSFISSRFTMQLNLKDWRTETNCRIKLSNRFVIGCPISYKLAPITIDVTTFPMDLIKFD